MVDELTEEQKKALEKIEDDEKHNQFLQNLIQHHGVVPVTKGTKYFAPVRNCIKLQCPIYEDCPYEGTKNADVKRVCLVVQKFVQAVWTDWAHPSRGVLHLMTPVQEEILGYHIMPLYEEMASLRIIARGLNYNNIVKSDDKGIKRLNPVFEQIRRTSKEIVNLMKIAGIDRLWDEQNPKKPKPIPSEQKLNSKPKEKPPNFEQNGDPNYYEREVLGKKE